MKGSTRTAGAIGVGYVLGREHKLRAATMLAVAAALGSTPMGGMLLKRGTKLVGSAGVLNAMPPEIGEIIDVVRGDLVPAGKAAVSAAATSRVDSLTGSLHERAERLRDPGAAVADAADETKRAAGEGTAAAKRKTSGVATSAKRRARPTDADVEPDLVDEEDRVGKEDLDDEDFEADEEPDETDDTRDESGDEDEDEDDEEPVTRVRRSSTRRRTPVAKARR